MIAKGKQEQDKAELCSIFDRLNEKGKAALLAAAWGIDMQPMYSKNVVQFPRNVKEVKE